MATLVQCPHCGCYQTSKTTNGKVSDVLAKTGAVGGGALLQMVTCVPGIFGANLGYGKTWHQFCCSDCHEAFKVRLGVTGNVKEGKKYY